MLRAYFDASYTEREGITCIGGYVGTEGEWNSVEAEWREDLKLFELCGFHLAELPKRLGHVKGDLCGLAFGQIIAKSSLHGIHAVLDNAEWDAELQDAETARTYPTRYHACLDMVLAGLQQHLELEFKGEKVAVTLDDDVRPRAAAEALFAHYKAASNGRLDNLTFGNRSDCIPLQVADLAAGTTRLAWLNADLGEGFAKTKRMMLSLGQRARGITWSPRRRQAIEAKIAKQRARE